MSSRVDWRGPLRALERIVRDRVRYRDRPRLLAEDASHPTDRGVDYADCEARFSPRMPDFNLENEAVRNEFKDIFKFWLDIGVDGFRLDAVTYYVTGSITKNTEILTWLNKTVKEIKPDAYIVEEAWSTESEYITAKHLPRTSTPKSTYAK